jgi:hypothetical protein
MGNFPRITLFKKLMKCVKCKINEATHTSKKVKMNIKVLCEKCHNEEIGGGDIMSFLRGLKK